MLSWYAKRRVLYDFTPIQTPDILFSDVGFPHSSVTKIIRAIYPDIAPTLLEPNLDD